MSTGFQIFKKLRQLTLGNNPVNSNKTVKPEYWATMSSYEKDLSYEIDFVQIADSFRIFYS